MFNAKDDFERCMKERGQIKEEVLAGAVPFKGSTGDLQRVECLRAYKDELKKNAPMISTIYEGYIQNYSIKDGSLIKADFKAEAAEV
jgi:hypothetical protein